MKIEYEAGFLDEELAKQFVVRGCITSLSSVVNKFDEIKDELIRRLKEEKIVSPIFNGVSVHYVVVNLRFYRNDINYHTLYFILSTSQLLYLVTGEGNRCSTRKRSVGKTKEGSYRSQDIGFG